MSLFNGEGGMSPADVAAVTGNNNGFGFGGDGAWWLLVLFLFAFNGNGWGGNGGNTTYNVDSAMQRGFDQSAVMNALSGINSTVANGFADQAVAQCGQTTNLLQGINGVGSQIANLGYNLQNTMMQNEMGRQVGNCNTNAAIADLKYTVATEACADRSAVNDALTSVVTSMNAGFQSIKDMQFQQQLDAERRENDNLRSQINMQNLASSQAAQTAALIADNAAQTQYVVNRVAPYPIPSYQVANPYVGTGWSSPCGYAA